MFCSWETHPLPSRSSSSLHPGRWVAATAVQSVMVHVLVLLVQMLGSSLMLVPQFKTVRWHLM